MDARTEELIAAHDVLAPFYAERLADIVYRMPVERAVLNLFAELVVAADIGLEVADVGCGTGRLAPYLAGRGLAPRGVDLSPIMIETARRDHPDFDFGQADVRALPFADASLAGVVCWYSLMYLPPEDRPRAFAEVFRVVRPGGSFTTAFKAGDGSHRRGGHTTGLGIAFDIWWLSPEEMQARATAAGFETVFWAGRPAEDAEGGPQGYLVARKPRDLDTPDAP
ncbi:MAG TPA: class I SAM-dependent methyltransferase [Jatrophihabitans sp.]|jgi:SAM-dependent methyltransferase|uniref:class I SAM-dependent methyltransferase n=1 Tax=Jatrophihabitans sp. TaxID=1932789 RepID=UPI002DFCD357|nr:class I SAM-dependent methyltransferase [Jatrophihabitans sp.]